MLCLRDNELILVTGSGPQVGKTTVREYLGAQTGRTHCATSDMLLIHLWHRKGVTPEEVKIARQGNPDAYRQDLIDTANDLRTKYSFSATLDSFLMGYQIVDGGRLVGEIEKARSWCNRTVKYLCHVHIFGRGVTATDNTEGGIASLANVLIENNETVDVLKRRAWTAVRDWTDELEF